MKSRLLKTMFICAISCVTLSNANSSTVNPVDYKRVVKLDDGTLIGPFSEHSNGSISVGESAGDELEVRSIFEFGLLTISAGSTVALKVHNEGIPSEVGSCFSFDGCPSIASFNVYGYTGDGTVNELDFNMTTSLLGTLATPPVNAVANLDITSFIASLSGVSGQYAGILLDATGDGTAFFTASLNVSSIPLPTAAWLFGSGLLGLIGVARRKAV